MIFNFSFVSIVDHMVVDFRMMGLENKWVIFTIERPTCKRGFHQQPDKAFLFLGEVVRVSVRETGRKLMVLSKQFCPRSRTIRRLRLWAFPIGDFCVPKRRNSFCRGQGSLRLFRSQGSDKSLRQAWIDIDRLKTIVTALSPLISHTIYKTCI